MLTREQILTALKNGHEFRSFDGRDALRLANFFPPSDWEAFGLSLKEGAEPPPTMELTEEAVRFQLAGDLSFAFDKALGKRGISASCMYGVVKMWMWVLEDELANTDTDAEYPQYGLPFLKAVAVKYGMNNPIGDDKGTEWKYSSDSEE